MVQVLREVAGVAAAVLALVGLGVLLVIAFAPLFSPSSTSRNEARKIGS